MAAVKATTEPSPDRTEHRPANRRQPLAALLGLVVVALSIATVMLALRPPRPVGSDAAPVEFAAARAMPHVRAVSAGPHPTGTLAHRQVMDYLVANLTGLGWQNQVLTGTAANPRLGPPTPVGRVSSVVATLPGRSPTGTVYLAAHYDSIRVGPGASDDAVAVGALLEVARALVDGERPRNTIVLLLTDGEEDGLLGARLLLATVDFDPRASVLVNFEARGSHGPLIAFETSTANSDVLAALAGAPRPLGFSLGHEVYRRLPQDTDFTEFRRAGMPGINLAFLDGSSRYHTDTDSFEHVDASTVQHAGELALRLARTFGEADLAGIGGGESTFFWVPGFLVRYPNTLALPLAIAAVAAVGALCVLTIRRGRARIGRLGLASLTLLAPMLAAPLLAVAGWLGVRAANPGYADLVLGDPYRPGWARAGVIVLGSTAVLTWYATLRRRLGPESLFHAALIWMSGLGLLLAIVAPGGAYLFSAPALMGAGAGIAATWLRDRPGGALWPPVAHAVSAVVTALVAVPIIALLLPTLGLAGAAVPVLLVVLLAGPVLPLLEAAQPLIEPLRSRVGPVWARLMVPVAGSTAALLLLGVAAAVDRFDTAHPRPASLVYTLDADTGVAQWLSSDRRPDAWVTGYAGGEPRPVADQWPNLVFRIVQEYRSGPAAVVDLAAPELSLVEQSGSDGDGRTLVLRLRSPRGAPVVSVRLAADGPALTNAIVDGVEVPVATVAPVGGWGWGFVVNALPAEGVEVRLRFATAAPVRARVIDEADGLAGLPGLSPRPPGVGQTPLATDITCVARTVTL